MNTIVFKPIISLGIMIPFTIVMLVIVIINRKHIINRFIILALVLIISQRPMLRDKENLTYNLDIDVLFVVDNTVSMNAIDINNETRMNAMKKDCEKIMDSLTGASFAVITFANYSQIKMPFSSNSSDILHIINNITNVEPFYAVGSNLDLPTSDMKLLLESSKTKDEHYRAVFYISDGELTISEKQQMDLTKFSELKNLIGYGAVLGYGTETGGKIKVDSTLANYASIVKDGYLQDKTTTPSKDAVSKIDEGNLKTIADAMGIKYIHMPNTTEIDTLINDIVDKATKNREDVELYDKDIYYYFSMTLLVFLFYELLYYRRNEQ